VQPRFSRPENLGRHVRAGRRPSQYKSVFVYRRIASAISFPIRSPKTGSSKISSHSGAGSFNSRSISGSLAYPAEKSRSGFGLWRAIRSRLSPPHLSPVERPTHANCPMFRAGHLLFFPGRSLRISRNSVGPLIRRRFRVACSSDGTDLSTSRSSSSPAISAALARA
jgi:hypothetical protein